MEKQNEIDRPAETQERRNEVCTASVRLSATLSAATIAGVAVVAVLLWLLLS